MSGTAYLILRSLFPFIKEVLLEDKGLKDLLLGNKPAAILALCLLFVFFLLADTTRTVGEQADKNNKLTKDIEALVVTNTEQKNQIDALHEAARRSQCVPGDGRADTKDSVRPPKKTNLRSYVEDRLRKLEK